MDSDARLLQRYGRVRDADAFAELVRRYAGLVYGTCLRITRSAHDAEDVAQECFLELARNTGSITSSLSGWLHAVARNRSLNIIRDASTRRRYEKQVTPSSRGEGEPTWAEIAPYVDQALAELPEELRVSMLLHYFEGRSQGEVALRLGVNQSTVSRRLDKGVKALRARLKKAGVVASVAALVTVLTESAACAAPASLMATLGKMAAAGVGTATSATGAATAVSAGSTAPSSAVPTAFLGTLKAKTIAALVAAAVAGAVLVGAVVAYRQTAKKPQGPASRHAASEQQPGGPAVEQTAGEPVKEDAVTTTATNEEGKARIEGVENFDNSDSGLSHLRAIACVLRHYGVEVNWDWLMGVSGEAFCYAYHPDGTHLSQFVHSWDVTNAALGAYGYEGTWRSEHSDDVTPALKAIESELARGRLVIAPGIMPAPNGVHSQCDYWFVVTAIDGEAQKLRLLGAGAEEVEASVPWGDAPEHGAHPRWYGIVRSFCEGFDGHYGPAGSDNPLLFVRKTRPPAEQKDVVLKSLRRAIDTAREGSTVCRFGWGAGTYLSGHTALQRLHDDLLAARGDGLDEYRMLNPPKGDPFGGLGDELAFLRLLSVRRQSAARFLDQVAPLLPKESEPHLRAASGHFRDSAREAMRAFEIRYGSEEELARMEALIREGKHGDDNPEWVAYWKRADEALASPHEREVMARHVARVLESEKAAIAEIERALAVAEIE